MFTASLQIHVQHACVPILLLSDLPYYNSVINIDSILMCHLMLDVLEEIFAFLLLLSGTHYLWEFVIVFRVVVTNVFMGRKEITHH